MTHLETYLDCLKLLPGDFSRDMALMHSLDSQLLQQQHSLRAQQQQLLETFNNRRAVVDPPPSSGSTSSSPPAWLSLVASIRATEFQCHCLCEEKVALSLQVKEGLISYARRLEDETALSEKEMGPDMVREALEAGERRSASKSAFGIKAAASGAGKAAGKAASMSGREKDRGWREREKERERERLKAAREDGEDEDDDLRLDSLDTEDGADDDGRLHVSGDDPVERNAADDDGGDGGDDFAYAQAAAAAASGGSSGAAAAASGEDVYCFCHTPSYGDMVACDDPDCKYECAPQAHTA